MGQLNKILEISDSEAGLKVEKSGGVFGEGECGDDDVEELLEYYHLNLNRHRFIKVLILRELNIRQLVIMFSFPKTVRTVFRGFRKE